MGAILICIAPALGAAKKQTILKKQDYIFLLLSFKHNAHKIMFPKPIQTIIAYNSFLLPIEPKNAIVATGMPEFYGNNFKFSFEKLCHTEFKVYMNIKEKKLERTYTHPNNIKVSIIQENSTIKIHGSLPLNEWEYIIELIKNGRPESFSVSVIDLLKVFLKS